jgi:HEAT repeat protein
MPTGDLERTYTGTIPDAVDAAEEQERKGLLAQLTVALLKAMMTTGIYPPDHPSIRNVATEPYAYLKRLEPITNEITYMSASAAVGDEIVVEGALAESVKFSELVHTSMATHFAHKFTDYFQRNHLVSFSVKPRIGEEEFRRFLSLFMERRSKEEEQPGDALAVPFSTVLLKNGIIHVSAMAREEMVGGERPLPWRVKMAISRLRKDLREIPLYSDASPEKIALVKTQAIQDITRPLRKPQFLKELLSNSDLITLGVQELQAVDVDHEIIWSLHPGMVISIAWEIVADLERAAWGVITQRVGQVERRLDLVLKELLKKIALRLKEIDAVRTKELLQYLFQKKILLYRELPPAIQHELLVDKWTDQFLGSQDAVLERFSQITDPGVYKEYITSFQEIFPELARRRMGKACAAMARILREHREVPSPDVLDRQERARVATARFTEPLVLDLFVPMADAEDKELRGAALATLETFGERALALLFRILFQSQSAAVRREVAACVEKMGEDAHVSLMETLGQRGLEWYVYRNVIMLLGNTKCLAATGDVQRFISHPHPRVREETLRALQRLKGDKAVQEIVPLLRDSDKNVARKAMAALAQLKCTLPIFQEALLRYVREPSTPDELQLAALDAIAAVGLFTLKGEAVEEVLTSGLHLGGKLLTKVLKKRPASARSDAVRAAICTTLGTVGGPEAFKALERALKDPSPVVRERAQEAVRNITRRYRGKLGS